MSQQAVLRAISEPRRQELLAILQAEGQLSVGELAKRVEVTQQSVSLHLKVLEDAGLVEARREGTRHIYAVRPEGFKPAQEFVAKFWNEQLAGLKREFDRE